MSSSCLSCSIVTGQVATLGDVIMETLYFHAHQDFAYPIPGFVILASKRHFQFIDQMSPAETADFMNNAQRIRSAQRAVLDIEHVYFFQNEDTKHHFHLWMVPRYAWMDEFGKSVESLRPAMAYARDKMASPAELAKVENASVRLHTFLAGDN